jgi:hypothetical protein
MILIDEVCLPGYPEYIRQNSYLQIYLSRGIIALCYDNVRRN